MSNRELKDITSKNVITEPRRKDSKVIDRNINSHEEEINSENIESIEN